MSKRSTWVFAIFSAVMLLAGPYSERVIAQSTQDTTGPYKIVMEMDPSLPEHTVYRPEDIAGVKGKMPIVAFANGGCGNAGNFFAKYLAQVASYGFLVVANGPIDPAIPAMLERLRTSTLNEARAAGQGAAPPPGAAGPMKQTKTSQLYETMDWAKTQNDKAGSPYKGKLDTAAIAVMGQSCGGLQALEAAADPRVKTAVIMNSGIIRNSAPLASGEGQAQGAPMRVPAAGMILPGSPESLKKLHTPIIYIIGGESDIAFKNAETDFGEIDSVPVFKANTDTGHMGTLWEPHGGKFAEVATQWLLWKLKGDEKAGLIFAGDSCGLCRATEWKVRRKNWK
jgi:hypothetical protein